MLYLIINIIYYTWILANQDLRIIRYFYNKYVIHTPSAHKFYHQFIHKLSIFILLVLSASVNYMLIKAPIISAILPIKTIVYILCFLIGIKYGIYTTILEIKKQADDTTNSFVLIDILQKITITAILIVLIFALFITTVS